MLMPLIYAAEFNALGTSMGEMLELQRVDPTAMVSERLAAERIMDDLRN